MLLEMYILKISTVSFWHGIEYSDRCCVTVTNHIRWCRVRLFRYIGSQVVFCSPHRASSHSISWCLKPVRSAEQHE